MNPRLRAIAGGIVLVCTACSSSTSTTAAESNPETTTGSTTTNSTVLLPAVGVAAGDECDQRGTLGVTEDGVAVLCSETALDGSPLDPPEWRATAAEADTDMSEALSTLREFASGRVNASADGALTVFLQEFAAAVRLAAGSERTPGETVRGFIIGYAEDNQVDRIEAENSIAAFLIAIDALFDPSEPAAGYNADMLAVAFLVAAFADADQSLDDDPAKVWRFMMDVACPLVEQVLAMPEDAFDPEDYDNILVTISAEAAGDDAGWAVELVDYGLVLADLFSDEDLIQIVLAPCPNP